MLRSLTFGGGRAANADVKAIIKVGTFGSVAQHATIGIRLGLTRAWPLQGPKNRNAINICLAYFGGVL